MFNIISVDDNEFARLETDDIFKELNINIINVKNEEGVLELLNNKALEIHALIWMFNMVDSNCFTAIKRLKSKSQYENLPVIIISQFTDKKYIVKAVQAGAIEYIAKPFDEKTILKKLRRILGIPYNNTDMPDIDDDIQTFNFSEMFSREIKSASRGSHPLSLLFLTVVNKNGVKDPCNVDELVQILSLVLRTKLRETDTCFCYGSESILMLLPFADKPGAEVVVKKIHECFDTHTIIKQKNKGCTLLTNHVTFPEDGKIKEVLLDKLLKSYDDYKRN